MIPGEGLSPFQVMSPSAHGQAVATASALVSGESAYGATDDCVQAASDGLHSGAAQQPVSGGVLENPRVHDPAPMLARHGNEEGNLHRTAMGLVAPTGEPLLLHEATSAQPPAGTTFQMRALADATLAPQQQTTELVYPLSPQGFSGPSSRYNEQASMGGAQQTMVRWVSRLTEYLRTSMSRGTGEMSDMAQSGFVREESTSLMMTPARMFTLREDQPPSLGTHASRAIVYSPPEELPQREGPPMPIMWTQTPSPQGEPLFSQDQIRRMEGLQSQSALLFPRTAGQEEHQQGSSGDSSHSTQVHEVQRQLRGYDLRQRQEIQRLQQEIFDLRAEEEALRHGRGDGEAYGSSRPDGSSRAASFGQAVAKAVRPLLPLGLLPQPQGGQIAGSSVSVASAPTVSQQLPVPQGALAGHGPQLASAPTVSQQLPVPQGALAGHGPQLASAPTVSQQLPVPQGALAGHGPQLASAPTAPQQLPVPQSALAGHGPQLASAPTVSQQLPVPEGALAGHGPQLASAPTVSQQLPVPQGALAGHGPQLASAPTVSQQLPVPEGALAGHGPQLASAPTVSQQLPVPQGALAGHGPQLASAPTVSQQLPVPQGALAEHGPQSASAPSASQQLPVPRGALAEHGQQSASAPSVSQQLPVPLVASLGGQSNTQPASALDPAGLPPLPQGLPVQYGPTTTSATSQATQGGLSAQPLHHKVHRNQDRFQPLSSGWEEVALRQVPRTLCPCLLEASTNFRPRC